MLSGHRHFLPCRGASRLRGDSGGPSRVFCEVALRKSRGGGSLQEAQPLSCPEDEPFPPMPALDHVWLGRVGDLNLAPFISVLPRRKTLFGKYLRARLV